VVASSACSTRTYRVIDTTTDEPIAGANAHITITKTLGFGIGHPASATVAEWYLVSDKDGYVSISHTSAQDASVDLSKEGYTRIQTAKEFRHRNTRRDGEPVLLYFTRNSELTVEQLRFFIEYGLNQVEQKRKYPAADNPYVGIAKHYSYAKSIAKSGKEKEVLRGFCQFASGTKSQTAEEWSKYDEPPRKPAPTP